MNGRLLAQLACVAQNDSNAVYDSYAWPPRPPLSDEERAEAERLRIVASRLFYRATEAGWGGCGTDEIFAPEATWPQVPDTTVAVHRRVVESPEDLVVYPVKLP